MPSLRSRSRTTRRPSPRSASHSPDKTFLHPFRPPGRAARRHREGAVTMTAGTDPGTACVVCLAAFDTRSGAHRPTCSGRCRSRLFRLRRRKTVWNGAWLAGRRDVIGACSLRPVPWSTRPRCGDRFCVRRRKAGLTANRDGGRCGPSVHAGGEGVECDAWAARPTRRRRRSATLCSPPRWRVFRRRRGRGSKC